MTPRPHPTGFTLVELLVVVGVLGLLMAILLPSIDRAREKANRAKCASNLRQIGQACLLYTGENRGCYPRTRFLPGPAPLVPDCSNAGANATDPFAYDGGWPAGKFNNVPSCIFLLLRTEDITSEALVCPSGTARRELYGGGTHSAQDQSNFTNPVIAATLGYSYADPFPDTGAVATGYRLGSSLDPAFAVAADINPGTSSPDGQDQVTSVNVHGTARQQRLGNSNNHGKEGQNVLYGDGHVEFVPNCFVGIDRDNIYTSNEGNTLGVSPLDVNDSFLLPTDDN